MSLKSQLKMNPTITGEGILGVQVVVGVEIAAEEIDAHMNNTGAKPFQNATDLARAAITIVPAAAGMVVKGDKIEKFTRPMFYAGLPLLSKSLKQFVWQALGKTGGTSAAGLRTDRVNGPSIFRGGSFSMGGSPGSGSKRIVVVPKPSDESGYYRPAGSQRGKIGQAGAAPANIVATQRRIPVVPTVGISSGG